jgi:hypothetical protein
MSPAIMRNIPIRVKGWLALKGFDTHIEVGLGFNEVF